MNTTYKSTGIVLGNYWGGGKGGYQARPLQADTKEELLKEANELLKTGGLDNGMGFESLIGAILCIEKITTTEIDGKIFKNSEYDSEFIGELTEEEEDFLRDCW